MKKIVQNLKYFDYTIFIAVLLLASFGVIMVYSSSMAVSIIEYGGKSTDFFKKQLVFVVVGVMILLIVMNIPYQKYSKWIAPIIIFTFTILILVSFVGHTAGNAQSWFKIGGFSIQPAEFAKLATILYLSSIFSKRQNRIDDFKQAILPPLLLVGFIFYLVYQQPDLGTGVLILFIALVLTFYSGMPLKQFWLMFFGLLLIAVFVILLAGDKIISEQQLSRFSASYHAFEDEEKGYQVKSSLMAIASGGIFGRGLGESILKFGYLPEPHTDMIISVVAEELGIFGVSFVILLLMYIVIRGYMIAFSCRDLFGSLLVLGIVTLFGAQAIVNIGVAVGWLPVTGVTLPLVSYGGSSLIITMISMGIVLNVSASANRTKESKS
ncbi:MAG TPA: putative lipid II flippase FtsW [Bacteroidales bacterium]|nr:putative lipid II flippase FtsW [Bacteroidales bacterium]